MTIGNYLVYGEPITGWTLLRSLTDDEENQVNGGEWVLAYSRLLHRRNAVKNPSFIFPELPYNGKTETDDEIRTMLARARDFERSFNTDPQTGFGFYQCCLNHGFNPFNDEFYTWVAERITETAYRSQTDLSNPELEKLLDLLVSKEEYEKAALLRDVLQGKYTKGLDIF
jgi:hypothetical protein